MYSDYEGEFFVFQGMVYSEPPESLPKTREDFVYEVIRVLDGSPLLMKSHMDRLEKSMALLVWPELNHKVQIAHDFKRLIELNAIKHQNIKIRVDYIQNVLSLVLYPIHSHYPSPELYENGAIAGLYSIERNDPNVKAFDHNMYIAREALANSHFHELILVSHDGQLTEGSKSNVVFIKDNKLWSAPETEILMGITRTVLKRVADDAGVEWIEKPIYQSELSEFEGGFLTGTSIHLLPLYSIDDQVFDTAKQDMFKMLTALFLEQIKKEHEEDLE